MATQIAHSGGLVDAVLELGFDQVKYFEGVVAASASGFTITPPAKRVVVENLDADNPVYLRINGGSATTSVSFVPGDDIKIQPSCSFSMDFDSVTELSFIANTGNAVSITGLLGFKGTVSC